MFVIHKKHIIFVSLLLAVLLCGCVLLTALSTSAVSTNGMTIVLDAGHGGIDGGVTGVNSKVKESEINLSIVRLLETQLAGAGFKVVLTRKSEGGLYSPTDKNKKKSDMKKRKEIIEAAEPVAVVSVHQNKFPLSSRKGGQVFFRNDSAQGKALAASIQEEFNALSGGGLSALKGDYYILNCTDYPSVIAECGFLSNPEEDALLNTQEYQKKVAYALYKGIVAFIAHNVAG